MNSAQLHLSRWHAAVCVLLVVLGVRCTVAVDPFPAWGGDPFELEAPITGITPMFSLALDAATLLAAGAALWGAARRGLTTGWRQAALFAAGAAAVGVHTYGPAARLEGIVLASQWLAAIAAGWACAQAAREATARRLIVAGLAGLLMFLVVRGTYQVFVEQPMVYREFLRNKSQIIAAQGWNEGSPNALAYERRIRQAEATGWFGLSNVYSTLLAAGAALFAGLAWGAWRRAGRIGGGVLSLCAGAAACGWGVFLSHSKGGAAAALLGVGLLPVLALLRRTPRWMAVCVGLATPLAALAAVGVRGAIGERWSELSLLFRAFYLEGAGRIISEHWLLGVGPAGFKDAYMLAKPAVSPEDVSSPHALPFDLAAGLGLGGVALAALIAAWGAGAAVQPEEGGPEEAGEEPPGALRPEVRVLFIILAAVTACAALFEHRLATLDGTLLRVVSLAVATALGAAVLRTLRMGSGVGALGVGAAALAGLTHAHIELTGITAGANMYLFILLGAASAGVPAAAAEKPARPAPALLVLACALAPLGRLAPVAKWEMALRRAEQAIAPAREFSARFNALRAGRAEGDSPRRLAADLSAAIGSPVGEDPESLADALGRVHEAAVAAAEAHLARAVEVGPPDYPTVRTASRVKVFRATLEHERGRVEAAREQAGGAIAAVEGYIAAHGATAPALAWLGLMHRTLHDLDPGLGDLKAGLEAYLKAGELAPYEPAYRVEAARLAARLGRAEEAARLAMEAMRLNENLRLDPIRQFGDRELAELRRLAGGAGGAGGGGGGGGGAGGGGPSGVP